MNADAKPEGLTRFRGIPKKLTNRARRNLRRISSLVQLRKVPMDVISTLYSIEEGFWLRGQDHFLQHLDERCLLAFPQSGELHGVFDRTHVAATATPVNRWRDLTMSNRHHLFLGDVAIISYRADVTRADGQPYAALVSSAYIRQDGSWKLAFHQHSPVSVTEETGGTTSEG